MAIKRKAKKKLKVKQSGASSRVTSDLRPQHNPRTPPCRSACPNHKDVRGVLTTIAQAQKREISQEEAYTRAFYLFAEKGPFPSVCGRVCPHPCESSCNRGEFDDAVSINQVERFVGDWALEHGLDLPSAKDASAKESIAVIGGGPAGLSCAYQMARRGYPVTLFEAFPKVGGMLRYGIPRYRLPREILDAEIQRITRLGVEIKTDTIVGKDISLSRIREEHDAVFIGIGAHKGRNLGIQGEHASNVLSGAEYLHRTNEGDVPGQGDKVLVIGGGDTAIDAARMARRHGAEVTIVYRRTRNEMPAIEPEIDGALEEGVTLHELAAPVEMILDENGQATGMKVIKCELGEPDASGRRRPVPIEGTEWIIDATMVIAAISQEPEFDTLGEVREGRDWIKVDEHGQMLLGGTPVQGTYAGGDATNLSLVTTAVAQGRFAAETMHAHLRGIEPVLEDLGEIVGKDDIHFGYYKEQAEKGEVRAKRHPVPEIPPAERFADIDAEISLGLSEEQVRDEAARCLSCGECFFCGTCYFFCQDGVIHKPLEFGQLYEFTKMEVCQGCKKCAEECPCGFILMK